MPNRDTPPWDRERRLYQFTCKGCGRQDATTLKRRRARGGLCRSCRRGRDQNPDQMSIFTPKP